ncbi:MAG: outer membrane protein assembly factor BamD [Alphaproteobacteria bacterium]|jgi:outer membrane protein assembly factor BamD|nr:outer membrane protein assembly factor BamD [Alphaproteobacteria bacterium]
MLRRVRRAAFAAAVLAVAACAGGQDTRPEYVERPVEDLYNEAMDRLDANDFVAAAAAFEEVERQHPYSRWATRAMFMASYAYYEARRYDDAILAAERFIDWNAGSEQVPYAQYLIGMSYYERISDVGRDQQMTAQAEAAFTELSRRFPDTRYARDAGLKLDLIRDHLAGKEMEVGRFYLEREQYVAAINRFNRVLTEYQTTTHVPEALHRMVEAYTALGVVDEARRYASVLGYNYPGSEWYERAYALVTDPDLPPVQS